MAQIAYDSLRDRACECSGSCRPEPPLVELVDLWSLMITSAFALEVVLRLCSTGSEYFLRPRYGFLHAADAVVVLVSFGLEAYLAGAEARLASLLTILRLWRVIKIVSSAETGLEDYDDVVSRDNGRSAWRRERAQMRQEIAELRRRLAAATTVRTDLSLR
ncbi:hypothetical protein BMF94_4549 [Rhodotorula taiwanensis]|uniref:Hydrogen voltage-gated channel 1 n=1 Tax=Rhodotorula taiwanensis TaxID=741276 RepID=A0A2S5B7H5_9BASI|nr:hypothetical protein BMF94_4549 [Rhodotorula taiwanensis]